MSDPRNTDLRDRRVTPWIPDPPDPIKLAVQRDLAKLAEVERRRARGPWYVWVPRDLFAALTDVFGAFTRVRVPVAVAGFAEGLFCLAVTALVVFGMVKLNGEIAGNQDGQRVAVAERAVALCEQQRERMHALHDDYLRSFDVYEDRAEDAKTKRGKDRVWDRADDMLDAAEALTIPTCERQRDALYAAEDAS